MRVIILYRPNSEHARSVEEFVQDFLRIQQKKVELISVDTRDGAATATLYDVMQYPTILSLRDDGQIIKTWEGEPLPLMSEVAYYAQEAQLTADY